MSKKENALRRKLVAGSMIFTLLLALFAVAGIAAAGGNNKVWICHHVAASSNGQGDPDPPHGQDDGPDGSWIKLRISQSAAGSHLSNHWRDLLLSHPNASCGEEATPPT